MIIEFIPLKIKKPNEQEKDENVKCVLLFQEEGSDDGVKTLHKKSAKSLVAIPENLLNKSVRFDATIKAYSMNGKTDLTIKINKILS